MAGLILASRRLPASSAAGAKASTTVVKTALRSSSRKPDTARAGLDLGNAQQRAEGRRESRRYVRLLLSMAASCSSTDCACVCVVSSRWRSRASGVFRSWAMSAEICRRLSISSAMRSSIRFKVCESRSRSSPVPRTGTRCVKVAGDDRLRRTPDGLDALEEGKAEREAA